MKLWIKWTIVVFGLLVCLTIFSIVKDNVELDGDALRLVAYQVAPADMTDVEAALALMNYVHDDVPGVCVEKSFMFERLARARGLKTRHIAFRDDRTGIPASHAASQVMLDNRWMFFDSYFGKVMSEHDYEELGFTDELVHINCTDGTCSNWSRLSYIGQLLFKIKFVHGSN